ncbi:hypothetical protein EJ06DRAFT_509469, partial [Trichodelitschia bisporula]
MASKSTCRTCLRASRSLLAPPRSIRSPAPALQSLATQHRTPYQPTQRRLASTSTPPKPDTKSAPVLETAKSQPPIPPPAEFQSRIARSLRQAAPGATETYVAYGGSELLFQECAAQADYSMPEVKEGSERAKAAGGEDLGVGTGWWYEGLSLEPTFATWTQVTMLHMYILTVRLRCLPAEAARSWMQHLTNHFFFAAETRMESYHGIHSKGIRAKYLKDLFDQWRGVLAAYDEGLVRGDAVLAGAVWRNVCKGAEGVDPVALATVVAYLRREVAR